MIIGFCVGYDIYYGPTKANSYFQWGSYCYLQIEQRYECQGVMDTSVSL